MNKYKGFKTIRLSETNDSYQILQDTNLSFGLMTFDILSKVDCGKEGSKQNAERLVDCWNRHEEMKELFEEILKDDISNAILLPTTRIKIKNLLSELRK